LKDKNIGDVMIYKSDDRDASAVQ